MTHVAVEEHVFQQSGLDYKMHPETSLRRARLGDPAVPSKGIGLSTCCSDLSSPRYLRAPPAEYAGLNNCQVVEGYDTT